MLFVPFQVQKKLEEVTRAHEAKRKESERTGVY